MLLGGILKFNSTLVDFAKQNFIFCLFLPFFFRIAEDTKVFRDDDTNTKRKFILIIAKIILSPHEISHRKVALRAAFAFAAAMETVVIYSVDFHADASALILLLIKKKKYLCISQYIAEDIKKKSSIHNR